MFGKSRFRAKEGQLLVEVERFVIQVPTLCAKNFLVISRRPLLLAVLLSIPMAVMGPFILGDGPSINIQSNPGISVPPFPLNNLGSINIANPSEKVARIVYSPSSIPHVDHVMQRVAQINNIVYGHDVRGFNSTNDMKTFVAQNLGSVQFAVIFVDKLLWSRNTWPLPHPSEYPVNNKPLNYIIFFNLTQWEAYGDPQSFAQGAVNVPLVVLQKSVEQSILSLSGANVTYHLSLGTLASYSPPIFTAGSTTTSTVNTTLCNTPLNDLNNAQTAILWVFTFGLSLFGIAAFQLVMEEKGEVSLITIPMF